MKRVFTTLCLPLLTLSAMAHEYHDDTRALYPNEISVLDLPSTAQKSRAYTPRHAHISNDEAFNGVEAITYHTADVVVFYQPSYLAKYGAYEADNRINAWVALANESYAAHGLPYQLQVNDIVPVVSVSDELTYRSTLDENGYAIKDGAGYLFSLAVLNPGSPEYDIYQTKWQADLVVYVRERRAEDSFLGAAGMNGELSTVLDNDEDPSTYSTLAHEIGHNLGMNHEEAKANVGPDYARAWECGGKRTIMYSSSPVEWDLVHYSTPDLSNGGEACGSETANNARVLEENFIPTTQRRAGVTALGTVSFTSTRYTGSEESGITVTLERDGDISQTASVKLFAQNGEALWGEDFTDHFVLAEFAEGSNRAEIIYPVIDDVDVEGEETFTLSMKYPYRLQADTTAVTMVIDDNVQTGVAGMFSLSGVNEITEGDEQAFTITRVGGVGEVVVNVTTQDGSAKTSADFVAVNEQLVFAEGELEKTVTLASINDDIPEVKKTFTLTITSPADTAEYEVSSLEVSILDDDEVIVDPAVGTFSLSVNATTVSESEQSLTVVINRVGDSQEAVPVRFYTTDDSALAGVDYEAVDTSIEFTNGQVEYTVVINIIDNELVEEDKTFTLHLEALNGEVSEGEITITISNDDTETPTSSNPSQPVNNAPSSSGGGSTGVLGVFLLALLILKRGRKSPC